MVQCSLRTEQEAVMQSMTNIVSARRRSNLVGFFPGTAFLLDGTSQNLGLWRFQLLLATLVSFCAVPRAESSASVVVLCFLNICKNRPALALSLNIHA